MRATSVIYPLAGLERWRNSELEQAVAALAAIRQTILQAEARIGENRAAAALAHQRILTGAAPGAPLSLQQRQVAHLYLQSMNAEWSGHQIRLRQLHEQARQATLEVIEKKRDVRIMEKHRERLQATHEQDYSRKLEKESDERWLMHNARSGKR
jgi:flagellar biosynthesis chaperone FliJ